MPADSTFSRTTYFMALNDSWHIRSRSSKCNKSNQPFADGDPFYTAIFQDEENGGFERRDFCVSAWKALEENPEGTKPYSFWRATFEVIPEEPKKQEVVGNESAEAMLRRLIEEDDAKSENARYILAIMLERKKIFRQADMKEQNGARMLFYEHTRSGEAFIVRDPKLQLAEIDAVQQEVALWLDADDQNQDAKAPATGDPSSSNGTAE